MVADVKFMKKYGTLFTAYFGDQLLGGQLYLEDHSCLLRSYASRTQAAEIEAKRISTGMTGICILILLIISFSVKPLTCLSLLTCTLILFFTTIILSTFL